MMLVELDAPTRPLIALAAAMATGNEPDIEREAGACLAEDVPHGWVDELLLQSTLMIGWPRALTGAGIWRRLAGAAHWAEDGADYSLLAAWRERGEAICREIYGANHDRLRANIRALHPALEAWMVTEGYGRTLGRPGLDLARRELLVVAQVAVQGAERQLHSHLKGALHAGASLAVLDSALEIVIRFLGPREIAVLASVRQRVGAT